MVNVVLEKNFSHLLTPPLHGYRSASRYADQPTPKGVAPRWLRTGVNVCSALLNLLSRCRNFAMAVSYGVTFFVVILLLAVVFTGHLEVHGRLQENAVEGERRKD